MEQEVAMSSYTSSSSSSSRCIRLITSILHSLISYLLQAPPPPPLLPVANTVAAVNPHTIVQNLHNLQLGLPAFMLSTSAALGLLLSQKFPAAESLDFVIVGFMGAAAFLLNGILFGKLYLQLLGITLCLLSFYALVALFLPIAFSCVCWLFGAFCLIPFLYVLFKPQHAQP